MRSDIDEYKLKIWRWPEYGVALINDGQFCWMADLAELENVLAEPYFGEPLDTGKYQIDAYTELCQIVSPLSADNPSVQAVCKQAGINPDVLVGD